MTILVQDMEIRYSAQLIIAALNEAPGIGLTIAEMRDTLGEISVLVADGRSSDRTVEIAKNLGAKGCLPGRSWQGRRLSQGI